MLKLNPSLHAWNTDAFTDVFKKEVGSLGCDELPLQQGLSHSSYANSDNLSVSVLNVEDDEEFIFVKAGLFYTGTIAGCNCADDPSPVDEINEYCEFMFRINKQTGDTTVSFVA